MLVDEVKALLEAEVAALAGRTHLAADLTDLVARKALPPSPVFAFVLPLGLAAGEADVSAGAFRQAATETVAVLIGVNGAGDAAGAKALPSIDALAAACIGAVCGAVPADPDGTPFLTTGAFTLAQGQLLEAGAGLVLYQLDFALPRQVRIIG